jgi:phage shock protein A
MWQRFKRWVRSIFGGTMDSLENPEKILRQNIRDMNDQIPRMNESIATIKANVTVVEMRLKDRQARTDQLKNLIKTALQSGRRDVALNYAVALEQAQQENAADEKQLTLTRDAYDKALKVKEAFLAEKKRKIEEAERAIARHQQGQWQKEVADALESFTVGGIDQTHNEMIERLNLQAAKDQARLEMALGNVDAKGLEIEKEAQMLHANELLRQFEMEMGLTPSQPAAEKTLGPVEEAAVGEATETIKTVGPKKTQES